MSEDPISEEILNDSNPINSENIEQFIKDNLVNLDELSQESKEFVKASHIYIDNRKIQGNFFEQDAQIYGNVAGRDYSHQTHTFTQSVSRKISLNVIEKIHDVYIKISSYSRTYSILNNENCLILQGESNLGKQTTAVYLLSSLSPKEILEINPAIEDLNLIEYQENQLYFIDNLAPSEREKQKINSYIIKNISSQLKNKNSYLVITINSRWQFIQNDLEDYLVKCDELPNRKDILEKHLKWYAKTLNITIDHHSLLENNSIQELLKNQLFPQDLDKLAQLLTRVTNQELSLEDALSDFRIRVQQQVQQWFENHSDLNQQFFFITLAVLNQVKYQIVDDASQQLQLMTLSLVEKTEETPKNASIFEKTRSSFLKEICAELVQGYENTERGYSPVEIIKLRNENFQPVILSHVWHEYNKLRDPLLAWLFKLGSHPSSEVRMRVAAAVGELSRYDFTEVLNKVLKPWANSSEQRLQTLAALSLSISVGDSNIAPQIIKLLHHWSRQNNNIRLRWTAARAYGDLVGLSFPNLAVRNLLAIAKSGNQNLFLVVIESLTTLFKTGEQHWGVLNLILQEIEQTKKKQDRYFLLLIFWQLMQRAKLPLDRGREPISIILLLIWREREQQKNEPDRQREYEKIVIYLLQCTLNLKETRKLISQELYNWLKIADRDSRFYPVLGGIFYKLIIEGNENERNRIFAYLQRIALLDPPNSASKILSKIQQQLNTH